MALIKKGDVFLVNFDPTVGSEVKKTRPGVVVSNDVCNKNSPIISIAPITSKVSRVYSFEVELPASTGWLRVLSKAMVNQTRAVDKVRLIKKLGRLSDKIRRQIDRALKLHYQLD